MPQPAEDGRGDVTAGSADHRDGTRSRAQGRPGRTAYSGDATGEATAGSTADTTGRRE